MRHIPHIEGFKTNYIWEVPRFCQSIEGCPDFPNPQKWVPKFRR